MKKFLRVLLCTVLLITTVFVEANAVEVTDAPKVTTFIFTDMDNDVSAKESRATGLITTYGIAIAKSGTTLKIEGSTYGVSEVVKSGFKNLTVERRKTSSDSWTEYYSYGNIYRDTSSAYLYTELTVTSGYQYRVTCKHYAKKSLLVTQTISNTSGIVTVS